jgi:hypothetical protein
MGFNVASLDKLQVGTDEIMINISSFAVFPEDLVINAPQPLLCAKPRRGKIIQ